MAAREMGGLSLADALALCELLAATDPKRYERAALPWLQRFIDERLPPRQLELPLRCGRHRVRKWHLRRRCLKPMVARSGPIPTRGDWSFEVKWDGCRAIVSTEAAPLRVRSRRGWDMTPLVPELSALPVTGTFDGELVAFGDDGTPDFPLLCERMLMRRPGISVTLCGVRCPQPRRT
jgi:hypothetical protein